MVVLTWLWILEESEEHSGDKEEFGWGSIYFLGGLSATCFGSTDRLCTNQVFTSRLPVVPIKVCHRFLLCSSFHSRWDGLKGGFMRLRGTGVNQGWGFVWVEGAVVIRPHGAMVSRGSSVVRHPSEVLWMPSSPWVIVRGAVFIWTPSLRVWMSENKKQNFSLTAQHTTTRVWVWGQVVNVYRFNKKTLLLTCHNSLDGHDDLYRYHNHRVVCEGSYCYGNLLSCGSHHEDVGHCNDGPCTCECHTGIADPLARADCCYLGSCTYGLFASLPYLLKDAQGTKWDGWSLKMTKYQNHKYSI